MDKLSIAELKELQLKATTAPSHRRWVHVRGVDFDRPDGGDTPADQVLVDYWMDYLLWHSPETGEVTLGEILANLLELVERFQSEYALYMLDSYIGPLVWRSPEREQIVGDLEAVRDASSADMRGAWDHFLADCRDSSWTLKSRP